MSQFKELKIYVSHSHDSGLIKWLPGAQLVKDIYSADLILFGGGADISPALYGCVDRKCHSSYPERDKHEVMDFVKAYIMGKPMLGICRGAQLLTAMSGGVLAQDINKHVNNKHYITTSDRRTFRTNSIHHQMMHPFELPLDEWALLAYAELDSAKTYGRPIIDPPNTFTTETPTTNRWRNQAYLEPEIVFYGKTNSLCIQGHPEMLWPSDMQDQAFLNYCKDLVERLMHNDLYKEIENKTTEKILIKLLQTT